MRLLSKKIPKILIVEMSDKYWQNIGELVSNPNYPTIDAEALMSCLVDILIFHEEFDINKIKYDIAYTLQETVGGVGSESSFIKDQVFLNTSEVVHETWKMLTNNGVFVDGQQPYEFDGFRNGNTVVLRKAPIFGD